MNKIRIYSTKTCPYCKLLKNLLDKDKIEYSDIDVSEDKNMDEFNLVIKITNSDLIPIIKIGKNILVPEKSFKSIPQAVDMIKTIINGS